MAGGLGGAVGTEARAGGEHVLGRDQHHVATRALQGEVATSLGEGEQGAFHVDGFELAKSLQGQLDERRHVGDTGVDNDRVDPAPRANDPRETGRSHDSGRIAPPEILDEAIKSLRPQRTQRTLLPSPTLV